MERREEIIRCCAKIASEFTLKPDRSIHPDITWEQMSESSRLVAHTTAQQIAQAILEEIGEKPQAGKTLADFANSEKAFKRPYHALCYGFIETKGFLKEFDWPDGNGPITLARLTAEDLTATDWEEVK